MKKYLFVLALVVVLVPSASHAAALTCAPGQIIQNVMTDPGTPAVPAVTHQVFVPLSITGTFPNIHINPAHFVTVVDVPAIPAVPATFVDQCVVDPGYVAPVVVTPTPTVSDTPKGGGMMPWCSSPLAPGWNTSFPDGGCGNQNVGLFGMSVVTWLKAGETVTKNGVGYLCPASFFMGCFVR